MIDPTLLRTIYISSLIALPIAILCATPVFLLNGYCGAIACFLFFLLYARLVAPVVIYSLVDDQRFDPDFTPGTFVEIYRAPTYFEIEEVISRCEEEVLLVEDVVGYIIDNDGVLVTIEIEGDVFYAHINCLCILPENVVAVQFEEPEGIEEAAEGDE